MNVSATLNLKSADPPIILSLSPPVYGVISKNRGSQISPKSTSYIKTLGARN
jgi:hypothetical protein